MESEETKVETPVEEVAPETVEEALTGSDTAPTEVVAEEAA